ncbi:MAG: 2-C-methyl-D-erythritol 2,4-cyclodiphosphate synthase [Prevotellaceae bacterium]|jgi:2-C-methyl-D-erythritol 2,4-cyclodiphosphate synthase|nr:2-C-methyl-D-erythritol 2,4-cyclodiphosphate synthase [Prevotellaceae bacterium]
MRIGFGYDVHRLAEGRELWLGGIRLEHSLGLDGHSDADVLIHAICDSLLGAAGLRDIGYYFPDNDQNFKNIDSKILLAKTIQLVRNEGFEIENIDSTVCAENPKINPYIDKMKETLAEVLNIPAKNIGIKATTTEKLGFVGKEEGIAAYAVALLAYR